MHFWRSGARRPRAVTVVIDGEAGIEQINRRVMEHVTHLILITDPSQKGLQVIKTIKKVADELVMYEVCGALVNRLPEAGMLRFLDFDGIPFLEEYFRPA